MARKGKEPAGLRRYRLEQKRKKAGRKAVRAAPKRKVKTMARRRSYGKRRGRKSRKMGITKMLGMGWLGYRAVDAVLPHTDNPKNAVTSLAYQFSGWDNNSKTWDYMVPTITYGVPIVIDITPKIVKRFTGFDILSVFRR